MGLLIQDLRLAVRLSLKSPVFTAVTLLALALGVAPLHGRALDVEDEEAGRNHVAVLGYELWRRDFGGDARVVGQNIKLNDEDYRVVGVMPPGFSFPSGAEMPAGQQFASATELWTPLTVPNTPAARNDRLVRGYRAVARLRQGVTVEQAEAETREITKQLVAEHADTNEGMDASVSTMRENQVGEFRPAMLALLGAVGFVLLIACANIANLLLSRAAARQKEFAIRAALGASRVRILRQLLTESLLLAIVGGLLGLLLSFAALRLLVAFAPSNIPRLADASIDWRVLAFTAGVSLLTGLLFGLAPALHASRPNLYEGVKEGSRGSAGPARQRLRGLLVVSEVVLAGLCIGALGALGLARLLSGTLPNLLFGVRAEDPATFSFVALLLLSVALVACYIPARRAVKVDPTTALRSE